MAFATCVPTVLDKRRSLPVDAMISDPIFTSTHAITINAPPEQVGPWIAQMGSGRAGWYSWDAIDNGGRPSSTSIVSRHSREQPHDHAGQEQPADRQPYSDVDGSSHTWRQRTARAGARHATPQASDNEIYPQTSIGVPCAHALSLRQHVDPPAVARGRPDATRRRPSGANAAPGRSSGAETPRRHVFESRGRQGHRPAGPAVHRGCDC